MKTIKKFKKKAKEEIKHIDGFEDYRIFDCFNQKHVYNLAKLNQFYDAFYATCIPVEWQKIDLDQTQIEHELTGLFNQKKYSCHSRETNQIDMSLESLQECKAIYVEWTTEGDFDLFFCTDFEHEDPELPAYEDWFAEWDYAMSLVDISCLLAFFDDDRILEDKNDKVRKALTDYINAKLLICVISAWSNSQLKQYPIAFAQHDADAVVALPQK